MSERPAPPPEVRIEPAAGEWESALRASWAGRSSDASALAAREALGLPTDRPIVMTGHQPIFFHAGVLAKYLAGATMANRTGGALALLIVDEDETDPGALRIPTLGPEGVVGERTLRLLPAPAPGVPAGWLPAAVPTAIPSDALGATPWAFVREGVGAIDGALRAHADAPSLAAQSAFASFDLMRSRLGEATPVLASSLSRTAAFADIFARLRDDPARFVRLHNEAVGAFPKAGVAPLGMDEGRGVYELPLWRVGLGEVRRRVLSDGLKDLPADSVAPRALLMTLVVRAALCDLFIHGTGGWEYDRITERLAREWLGVELAPMTLATATLRLPLLSEAPPSDREVAHAAWAAHRAAHDPSMLGDDGAARRKDELLARIEAAPRKSPERAALYRSLHSVLSETRDANAPALDRAKGKAASLRALHEAAGLANDRTWAFPLHTSGSIDAMSDSIDAALAGD